jgi:hypothetical protein
MGYVYQADVYCDDCGDNIRGKLHAQGKAPEDVLDYSSYDSDDFPKGANVEHEESDTPTYCAQCSKFLHNPLTSEGYKYVRDALSQLPALTSVGKLQTAGHSFLADWVSWYAFTYWDAEDCADDLSGKHQAPGWYSNESF